MEKSRVKGLIQNWPNYTPLAVALSTEPRPDDVPITGKPPCNSRRSPSESSRYQPGGSCFEEYESGRLHSETTR